MKKIYFSFLALLLSSFAFAGSGESLIGLNKRVTKSKPIVSGGFYLHVGIGFPSLKVDGGTKQSLGIQPSLELGNQFMFYRADQEKWGIGMNVSWVTFGFSSKEENLYRITDINLGLLRLGPLFSYGISDDIAVDAFFNINPHFHFGAITYNNTGFNNTDDAAVYVMGWKNWATGAKFRWKKLAVGFEVQFGKMNYSAVSTIADNEIEIDTKASYINPRILVGFKF